MSIIYSKAKDKIIDLDYEDELDTCELVEAFIEDEDFQDILYQNCNFETEYDDFQKWIIIADFPKAKEFNDNLIDFAEYELGRKLEDYEKKLLIEELERQWDDVYKSNEEWLIDKYRDYLDDDGGDY